MEKLKPGEEIYDIRAERLKELLDSQYDGNQSALARALGRQADYISRCLSSGQYRKRIGEEFARVIERSCGLPTGWMDRFEGTAMPFLSPQAVELAMRYDSLPPEKKNAIDAVLKALGGFQEDAPPPLVDTNVRSKKQ